MATKRTRPRKKFRLVKDEFLKGRQRAIELLSGPFEGIIYRYGDVQITSVDGRFEFSFDYDILENPNNTQPTDKLHDQMADILNCMFTEEFDIDENRKADPQSTHS